jgi:hypothetical protein
MFPFPVQVSAQVARTNQRVKGGGPKIERHVAIRIGAGRASNQGNALVSFFFISFFFL